MIKERKREGGQHGHDVTIDFVECMVIDMQSRVRGSCVDDRIPHPSPEPEAEE